MMTPEELKEIEERCNNATPGPWRDCHDGACSCNQIWSTEVDVPVAEVIRGEWGDTGIPYGSIPDAAATKNARFIAHSRRDVSALIEYIKELEKKIEGDLYDEKQKGNSFNARPA